MSRVPDLVSDSDTGTAKGMVTKTIDRCGDSQMMRSTH